MKIKRFQCLLRLVIRIQIFAMTILLFANDGYAQNSKRVINYPIELIYKKYLSGCLNEYGIFKDKLKNCKNTFISTVEFNERFWACDPKMFELYDRNDLELYKIDSLAANYFDSLARKEDVIVEEDSDTHKVDTISFKTPSLYFRKLSQDRKGKFVFIDYSKVDFKSKTLKNDLKLLGLTENEIEIFLSLIE